MLETTFSNTPLPLITAHDSSSAPSRLISMLSIWLTISSTFLGIIRVPLVIRVIFPLYMLRKYPNTVKKSDLSKGSPPVSVMFLGISSYNLIEKRTNCLCVKMLFITLTKRSVDHRNFNPLTIKPIENNSLILIKHKLSHVRKSNYLCILHFNCPHIKVNLSNCTFSTQLHLRN